MGSVRHSHRYVADTNVKPNNINGLGKPATERSGAHNGHNHPSGSSEPSAADRAVTLRLRDALAMVEIRLLDHFVVGDGPPCSLAARGWV